MPEQPQLVGGTISPEGAATSGAAPDVDLLSVSTIGATSTADRWWKFTAATDATVNFDAMLSYPATGARTSLAPDITVSVYQAGDLVTPIGTASSGIDPQQGSVSRGSVAVTVEAGVTYYIALTGGVDAYRILRVSDATPPGAWQTGPDAEFVQVIAPTGMTIEPVNFSGTYTSVVARSNKRISYGVTPAFAGPAAYSFPEAWSCAWEGHLNPCYKESDGQLWNNPPDDPSWNGSGICAITVPPGPTNVGIDFATPTVAWENSTDSTGHAFGRHTGSGYRIFHSTLLADDPGPTTIDELPDPPPGATVEWEDSDDGSRVLSLEIAATDDGTGDGEVAFRRFDGGYGVDADGFWWVGEKPDGDLLISGYDGAVSWQPYTLDAGTVSTVVGFTQYVEDNGVPPAPSAASTLFGEARNPELAFRLTWEPRRYRWIYPAVVPPIIGTGFPPLRIFGRSDGATHGARRVLGGGNTRQGGSRTLGSIL